MGDAEVSARVRYVNDSWRELVGYPRIDSGEDRRANTSFHDVQVRDARPLHARGELDLDSNGFVLERHETGVSDFSDRRQIETTYFDELCEVVHSLTGAAAVFAAHHVSRAEEQSYWADAYSRFVHLDYSEDLGKEWAYYTQKLDSLAEVVETTRKLMLRVGIWDASQGLLFDDPPAGPPYTLALYNCWKPIGNEVQRNPLTLVDARSVDDEDVVDFLLGGSFSALPFYRPEHRYYYFPRMQPDELLVFKQLDTRAGAARWCPHTSFDDPGSPAAPLERRSIEVRMVAIFGSSAA